MQGGRGRVVIYRIMYRKYVRKWLLLKINRIIYPEVAGNEQFLPGKSIFFNCLKNLNSFENLLEKNRNFSKISLEKPKFVKKICLKNRNFSKICLKNHFFVKLPGKKSKFLGNLPGKIEILLTRIHDPQISNQIDTAEGNAHFRRCRVLKITLGPNTTSQCRLDHLTVIIIESDLIRVSM